MASKNVLVIALCVALIPMATFAKEIIVGDEAGWATKIDYVSWAKRQDFQVGDKLVFKYTQGLHNVIKVDENSYKNCFIPANSPANPVLASGKDVVSLDSPGKKWYVCGIEKHCEKGGQKLEIEVKGKAEAPKAEAPKSEAPKAATPAAAPKADNKTAAATPAAATPAASDAPAPTITATPAPAPAPEASSANGLTVPMAIMGAFAALAMF